jgi:hypothetical protein
MRRIALHSAVGGMALSIAGMAIAFSGWLPPVGGAIFQEPPVELHDLSHCETALVYTGA